MQTKMSGIWMITVHSTLNVGHFRDIMNINCMKASMQDAKYVKSWSIALMLHAYLHVFMFIFLVGTKSWSSNVQCFYLRHANVTYKILGIQTPKA